MKNEEPPLTESVIPHGNDSESATPYWGYRGKIGPSNWGNLGKAFMICGIGHHQSPINIQTTALTVDSKKEKTLSIHYQSASFSIINNGHTIQLFADDESNTIAFNDTIYTLVQFHFHIPSEHTIDGKHKAMEIHFVHRNEQDEIVVVALFVNEGEAEFVIESFPIPTEVTDTPLPLEKSISIHQLIPMNHTFFHYVGSLTTPPCTEDVNWILLAENITMSKEQIELFRQLFHHNNRPIQPTNERNVTLE